MLEELLDALSGVVRSEDFPSVFPESTPVAPPVVTPATHHALWSRVRPSWALYGLAGAVASAGVYRVVANARTSH